MNRRSFLTASGTMLISTSPLLFATEGHIERPILTEKQLPVFQSKAIVDPGLSRRQWKTIISVQDHLFPSESLNGKLLTPGAKDVNSQAYLYAVLSDAGRDEADRQLVKDGLKQLQDICWKENKKLFTDLAQEKREEALRIFEKTPDGTAWLMTILGYVFEALLIDPVYGGNPGGIGWQWLEHRAGLPRPTMETRYFLL